MISFSAVSGLKPLWGLGGVPLGQGVDAEQGQPAFLYQLLVFLGPVLHEGNEELFASRASKLEKSSTTTLPLSGPKVSACAPKARCEIIGSAGWACLRAESFWMAYPNIGNQVNY